LAVNCYVEPVYTLDADLVLTADNLLALREHLEAQGFATEMHEHSLNAKPAESGLRIQFTKDERYQDFPMRAITADVLGNAVRVACLEDVTRGELWAYVRLAERYPELKSLYSSELRELIERG